MKKKLLNKEQNEAKGIIYKPCKFCGSTDYDMADGDVEDRYEGQVFEPDGCDVCSFKGRTPLTEVLH